MHIDVSFPRTRESSDATDEGVGSLRGNDTRGTLELRALAVLLDYPTDQTQAHMTEIAAALSPATRHPLQQLLSMLSDAT